MRVLIDYTQVLWDNRDMDVKCKCGKIFDVWPSRLKIGRGKYCSKKCSYKNYKRPNGLKYKIKKVNPTWFEKGFTPWNKGLKGWNEGSKNPTWKGDKVGYHGLHDWVYRHKGKPKICKHCGGFKNVEWANKSLEYKRDLKDWDSLCRKCHFKYDRRNGWGKASQKYPEIRKKE